MSNHIKGEAGPGRVIEMSSDTHEHVDWKTHGVKVIPGDQLDPNTAQTPGMDRAAAINLAYVAEAGPGDFIFVPPYVPHQEINASTDETLECVLVRSDNEAVVVNLDIEPVERPEEVRWIDPIHRHG